MLGVLARPALLLALTPFATSSAPVSAPVRAQLRDSGSWHASCPVPLSDLRVLTVTHWGFDGRTHTGRLIVNRSATAPLGRVFARLYRLHFPIRHLRLADVYGPARGRATDGDLSGSFECRPPVPSPCTPNVTATSWSMHAYGLAVDLNELENPYVGCGESHFPAAAPYRDRSRHRRGMVTASVVAAFRSVGWGWGGSWAGSTKDYTHFSSTGH